MTCLKFIKNVREKIENEINDVLEINGLEPVKHFCTNVYDTYQKPYSIVAYLNSPDESVYSQTDEALTCNVVVDFFLNDKADKTSCEKIEEYFSVIAEYLSKNTFGERSVVSNGQIARMDIGYPCNEALFSIASRIQSLNDDYYV